MPVSDDDAALVLAVRGGDRSAFDVLYRRWVDRCYDVARRIVRDDGRAAEVAQDVFLVAWNQLDDLQDPAAFGGWVLRSARNKALNRLEREQRSTAVAGDAPLFVDQAGDTGRPDQALDEAMSAADHQELVAAATAVLGEREASVLDLHLRHGLSAAEIGEELGVTTNNAHQLLFRTKKRLTAGIRAWVLVRRGRPSCDDLAHALEASSITSFGRPALDVIDRHVEDCDECTRRQAAALDPAALFAAAPVVVMAPALRAAVADGLRAEGVPVDADPLAPGGGSDGRLDLPGTVGSEAEAEPEPEPAPEEGDPRHRRWAALAVLAAVVAVIAAIAVGVSDGEEDVVATGTSVPEAGPTTTKADDEPAASTSTTGVLPAPTAPSTTTGTLVIRRSTTTVAAAAPPQPVPSTFAPNPGAPTTAPPATPTTTIGPPQIDSFTATPAGAPDGPCPPGQWATTLAWSTTGASSVRITATTFTTLDGLAADGSTVVCRAGYGSPPGGWHLTATGPGGTDSASA